MKHKIFTIFLILSVLAFSFSFSFADELSTDTDFTKKSAPVKTIATGRSVNFSSQFPFTSNMPYYCYLEDFNVGEYFYLASLFRLCGLDITKSNTTNIFVNLTDSAISMIRNYGNLSSFDNVDVYYPKSLVDEIKLLISKGDSDWRGTRINTHAYEDNNLYSDISFLEPVAFTQIYDDSIDDFITLNVFPIMGYATFGYSSTDSYLLTGTTTTGLYSVNNSTNTVFDNPVLKRDGTFVFGTLSVNIGTASSQFAEVSPLNFEGGYVHFESIPLNNTIGNFILNYDYVSNIIDEPTPPSILKYTFDNLRSATDDIFTAFVSLFSFDSIYFYFLVLFILYFIIKQTKRLL